jgi:TfoX/Sxy family transcriptional regulator of competence genes
MAIAFGLIRIFVFKIPESPRYLLSKGLDDEAVEAVNYIARFNKKPETLTMEMFWAIDQKLETSSDPNHRPLRKCTKSISLANYTGKTARKLKSYTARSYRRLFTGRKMIQHTTMIFLIWLTVGVAYPLYFAFITSYLETKSSYSVNPSLNHTYMVYCIVSAVGVVGPLAAGFCVETRLGRRWMMSISAILTGVFLFAYTAVGTEAANIGFQCATGVLGNFGMSQYQLMFMHTNDELEYAVMYAFTPESFPAPIRGTGTGVAATLLRVGGLVASLISTYSGYTVVPIYVSAALWVVVGLFCFGLPYETHGHASI